MERVRFYQIQLVDRAGRFVSWWGGPSERSYVRYAIERLNARAEEDELWPVAKCVAVIERPEVGTPIQ